MLQQAAPADRREKQEKPSAPMRVSRVSVRNFRLLRKVDIDLDCQTTVLVGRNNSGKTTLGETFTRFLQPSRLSFIAADFSTESYVDFRDAWLAYDAGEKGNARALLPTISLTVEISYSKDISEYGPLAAAIVDLDPDCTVATVRFAYSLEGGRLDDFFEGVVRDPQTGAAPSVEAVLSAIGERVPKLFERSIIAIDPNDMSNTREITLAEARSLLSVHFLRAQRGLDDEKERPKDLIGKVFQDLFDAASNADDGSAQRATANALTEAVSEIEEELGARVGSMMVDIIPALKSFGYPGLTDPGIEAATTLDVERLLADHTSIRYQGVAGISFPESYSGLGSRNLILMLLTLLSHYRDYASRGNMPGLHLVFIEEPEAHLHPQMQEVFIEQLSSIADLFPALDARAHHWWPQFAVSTHSSHVANRADFSSIRYFRVEKAEGSAQGRHADVLDLSEARGLNAEFLHQYLTLTRSDLFFADKAILVEGTSERLMVPAAIRNSEHKLGSQYVALMEVGGAYAHLFFPLLDFLGLPALIITDIDSIGPVEGKTRNAATIVHEGVSTSNATIKAWFPSEEAQAPTTLLAIAESGEIIRGNRYLAFQVPEAGAEACGRTFEDAFVLANPSSAGLTLTGDAKQDENLARDAVIDKKKSDFALRFAVEETGWQTPRYIQRGLDWLLEHAEGEVPESGGALDRKVVVR
ncbi:ATP-dependent nuclease [Agromyces badenianii]|uniref:ATP-dependent nuclease n=1 Tax=Agromyces badenianii TaxID=2080742 RepID=UPI000D5A1133|nr:AAA family ATPase [Agromyces badenianii]PWC02866.1 ATP-dependent endonuclease [Agromyces badenianii]